MAYLVLLNQFANKHKKAILTSILAVAVLCCGFALGWRSCVKYGANVVEKTKVVTEIKEVKIPVKGETRTEIQYVEKETPQDADVQINTSKPQVVVDYNGEQTRFDTLDSETKKFEDGKLKVEQESKTVLDVTPIVQREVQTAVEKQAVEMDAQKNKEISEVKQEEKKKRHRSNVGSFLAGVAGGLVLHAYF